MSCAQCGNRASGEPRDGGRRSRPALHGQTSRTASARAIRSGGMVSSSAAPRPDGRFVSRAAMGHWTDDEVAIDSAHCAQAVPARHAGRGARGEGDARAHDGVSRRGRAHRDSRVRQLLAAFPPRTNGAQPQDRDADRAAREVRPLFPAGQGTSRARRSTAARSTRRVGRRVMVHWGMRTPPPDKPAPLPRRSLSRESPESAGPTPARNPDGREPARRANPRPHDRQGPQRALGQVPHRVHPYGYRTGTRSSRSHSALDTARPAGTHPTVWTSRPFVNVDGCDSLRSSTPRTADGGVSRAGEQRRSAQEHDGGADSRGKVQPTTAARNALSLERYRFRNACGQR